jgi:predicted RNA-binding protein with PUA-like domain
MTPLRTRQYWLLKSEPEVFSIDDFKREKSTLWTGVRNFQARNSMMGPEGIANLLAEALKAKKKSVAGNSPTMHEGDLFLFYHSNAEPAGCVGIGRIERTGVPDPEQFDKKNEYFEPKASKAKPMWFCAEVGFQSKFKNVVTLDQIRGDKELQSMVLLQKGSRLSVQPVTEKEFDHIRKLGEK